MTSNDHSSDTALDFWRNYLKHRVNTSEYK